MPFKSEAQRRWMYANKPEMAKRWEKETPKGRDLPDKLKKKTKEKTAGGGARALKSFRRAQERIAEHIAKSRGLGPEGKEKVFRELISKGGPLTHTSPVGAPGLAGVPRGGTAHFGHGDAFKIPVSAGRSPVKTETIPISNIRNMRGRFGVDAIQDSMPHPGFRGHSLTFSGNVNAPKAVSRSSRKGGLPEELIMEGGFPITRADASLQVPYVLRRMRESPPELQRLLIKHPSGHYAGHRRVLDLGHRPKFKKKEAGAAKELGILTAAALAPIPGPLPLAITRLLFRRYPSLWGKAQWAAKAKELSKTKELAKVAASKQQVHQLASKLSIPWDDDPKFMRWTKKLTGKTCLDKMDKGELSVVYLALKQRGKVKPHKEKAMNKLSFARKQQIMKKLAFMGAGVQASQGAQRLYGTPDPVEEPGKIRKALGTGIKGGLYGAGLGALGGLGLKAIGKVPEVATVPGMAKYAPTLKNFSNMKWGASALKGAGKVGALTAGLGFIGSALFG